MAKKKVKAKKKTYTYRASLHIEAHINNPADADKVFSEAKAALAKVGAIANGEMGIRTLNSSW